MIEGSPQLRLRAIAAIGAAVIGSGGLSGAAPAAHAQAPTRAALRFAPVASADSSSNAVRRRPS